MSRDWVWKWKCILLLALLPLVYSGGQFNGGSVSYSITQNPSTNKLEVNLDVIIGWELGKGPCGPGCNKHSIGKSTLAQRRANAANYFGDWNGEVKLLTKLNGNSYTDIDLTSIMLQNMTEKVIAVSEKAKWEQEWMQVTLELPDNLDYEDIKYVGSFWHDLSIQGNNLHWHIQAKILPGVRSDTGKPNASPRALAKPYYRIKMDKRSTIKIASIDPDGDFIKCEKTKNIEAGKDLLKISLNGVTVNEDCTVVIDTDLAHGYHDGDWVAITLIIRDYNRKYIQVEKHPMNPVSFSLSSTGVQFLVQVLDNLREPEFIEPTLDSNHEIIIYAGATWTTDVYAIAAINTTIEEFVVTVRGDEHFLISDMHDDPTRTLVKYIHLSWAPTASDIGHHITCVRVSDNTGIDSASDRCFLIEVKDQSFHSTAAPLAPANKPVFIDLPTLTQTVSCKLDTTCIFPVFVLASSQISKIEITQNFLDESFIGDIVPDTHGRIQVYKTDVSIIHSLDGSHNLCLVATDVKGVQSDETCLKSDIDPADPCLSSPCQNSALCSLDSSDLGVYKCVCKLPGSYGTHCENIHKGCESSPCRHNATCFDLPPTGFYCACDSDYSGDTCNIVKNKCNPDPCNGHGICKDDGHTHTCSCFDRYDGADCSNDLCPGKPAEIITCASAPSGCTPDPCNGHGVCRAGGICTCSMGYRSASPNCDTNIGGIFASVSKISFKPPTPTKGSTMTCVYTSTTPEPPCIIAVYFVSTDSATPTVNITDASVDLIASSTMNPTDNVTYIPGIEHMYSSNIIIRGSQETKERRFICVTAKDTISEVKLCIELMFVLSPLENPNSPEYLQKDARCKFLEPTPLMDTKFVCNVDRTCSFMMFTTYNAGCKQVITTDKSVTVFQPISDRSLSCVTEVSYKFPSPGLKHICLQSAIADFQTRCFYVDVLPKGKDPCRHAPCQNDGICFFEKGSPDVHNCVCKEGFKGLNCEKGPCLPADDHCARGYCVINNHVTTCLCPLGYSGPTCSHEIPTDSPDPEKNGATFTDTARPTAVTCIKNRPCSIPFVVSGKFPPTTTSVVSLGYVSPSVVVNGIATVTNSQPSGSYQSNVQITAQKDGMHDVCLQTVSKDGTNQDEMCFKLDITTDTSSVYGFKDRAHFTTPSLPPDSHVTCNPTGACHVLYHVTPGEGNDGDCTSVQFSAMPFENSHIFSTCDTCVTGNAGNNNCSIDVTLFPTAGEVGIESTVCLSAELVSNNERGEERCFNVSVKSEADFKAKSGCQKIHCKNGGFCDGHTVTAVCFCKRGFSGPTCQIVDTASTSSATSSQTLVGGDVGIPKELKCILNEPCPIPFQVTGKPNIIPTITTGYTDPSLIIGTPAVDVKHATDKTTDYTGSVNVSPTTPGKHVVCVQTTENSLVDDEMCITIDVGAGPLTPADKNKPFFLDPTYRSDSTILCKENQYCHIEMHYTKGDLFGSSGKCPSLSYTSPNTAVGIFIFATEINTLDCSNDVTYASPSFSPGGNSTHQLCFRVGLPGKKGEQRCFNIKIVSDMSSEVISPCSGSECGNGGKCIADMTSSPPTAACVCSHGFQGSDCKTAIDKSKDLDGVKDPPVATSNTPHFNGDSSIPKEITCVVNTPCALPVMYHGDITHPPTLGYVDPGLSASQKPVTTLSTPGSTPASHALTTLVTATTTGDHLLCLQTNADGLKGGVNIDELCVHVEVQGPANHSAPIPPTEHFHSDNLPDNSTMTCSTESVCHVPITTNKLPAGKCPEIRECGQGIPGVHVFQTSLLNGKCTTDVAYKTGTVQQTNTLCISASPNYEELHYQVETTDRTDFGPCQKLHCQNGGFCNAKTNACECKAHFSGTTCDQDVCSNLHCENGGYCVASSGKSVCLCKPGLVGATCGTNKVDLTSAIPDSIACVQGQPCFISFPVPGINGGPPAVISNSTARTTLHKDTTASPPVYHATLPVSSSYNSTVCFDISSLTSSQACVHVSRLPPQHRTPSPGDFMSTKPSYECKTDTPCFISVSTLPNSDGSCPQVSTHQDTTLEYVHVFDETQTVQGHCVTSVTVAPSTSNTGDHQLCLLTPNSLKKCIKVHVRDNPDPGNAHKDCGVAPPSGTHSNKLASSIGTTPGSTALYQCDNGYENPSNSMSITCHFSGNWDTVPTCTIKDCGHTIPKGAHVSCVAASSTIFGSTATCTCETGYGSTDNMAIACLADGSWDTPPTCTIDVCTTLHCENGGYCVASSGKPVCLCKPGLTGTTCGTNKVDTTSAIPNSITCIQGQPCFVSFPVPGINGRKPTIVSNGTGTTTLDKDTTAKPPVYHATVSVTSINNSTVCFNISSGSQPTESCVHVSRFPPRYPTPPPGDFTTTKPSYKCKPDVPCFLSVSTIPYSNGSCPQISTHQDTTLEYVHVFDETQLVHGHCVTSVTVSPSTSNTGDQQLCLTSSSSKNCIKVLVEDAAVQACDLPAASVKARKSVSEGFASCYCVVNGKRIQIIRKRPVAKTETLVKNAGYGAAGMSGGMLIAVGVYVFATKRKTTREAHVKKERVHSKTKTTQPQLSAEVQNLDF